MRAPVGIRALAIAFPDLVRENEYWRRTVPEAVADAEKKTLARLFSAGGAQALTHAFDIEMAPYLADPFRGTVERRVLRSGEGSLGIELRAARDALSAAGTAPG